MTDLYIAAFFSIIIAIAFILLHVSRKSSAETGDLYAGFNVEAFDVYREKQFERISALILKRCPDCHKNRFTLDQDSWFYIIKQEELSAVFEFRTFRKLMFLYESTLIENYKKAVRYSLPSYKECMVSMLADSNADRFKVYLRQNNVEEFILYSLPLELQLFEASISSGSEENFKWVNMSKEFKPQNYQPPVIF